MSERGMSPAGIISSASLESEEERKAKRAAKKRKRDERCWFEDEDDRRAKIENCNITVSKMSKLPNFECFLKVQSLQNVLSCNLQRINFSGRAKAKWIGKYSNLNIKTNKSNLGDEPDKLTSADNPEMAARYYLCRIADVVPDKNSKWKTCGNIKQDVMDRSRICTFLFNFVIEPHRHQCIYVNPTNNIIDPTCFSGIVRGNCISDNGEMALFNPEHPWDDDEFFKNRNLCDPTSKWREYDIVMYHAHGKFSKYYF
jgi:hypothetical protein